EPTNHLDMHSVELLAEALNKYEGTYILVSHDRYFISKTANKIWEIVDHEIKEFKGDYNEWVAWKERMQKQQKQQHLTVNTTPATTTTSEVKETSKPKNNIDREQQKELQKVQRQFQKAEETLEQLKAKQTAIELELADPKSYSNPQQFATLESNYKQVQQQVKEAAEKYEQLFEQIMLLEDN
ncbi:MAG TPA: ABC transporter ATP-binding protein, partial [Chitinophagaceae bacterium]|nr:ABC transporter ATP-binding protein [Chitinophagaceae bacterium]